MSTTPGYAGEECFVILNNIMPEPESQKEVLLDNQLAIWFPLFEYSEVNNLDLIASIFLNY